MILFTTTPTGQDVQIYRSEFDKMNLFQKDLCIFLYHLEFPGIAVHLAKKMDTSFRGSDITHIILTIMMRQFGRYASLGWEIEVDKNLDSNWDPTIEKNYVLDEIIIHQTEKFTQRDRNILKHDMEEAVNRFLKTSQIYKRLMSP